jgi:hypothetical protein
MLKIQATMFLFVVLVVTLSSGIFFKDLLIEGFRSSSETNKGQGIGDSHAAALDLPLTTDNVTSNFFNKNYSINQNGLDDLATSYGFPQIPTNL